jgi:hypothetical protein
MSDLTPLEQLHISAFKPSLVISLMASISPSEEDANPASMTSTPSSSNFLAIWSLCSGIKETPGVCSPSLRVVSKILIFLGKLLDKAIPHLSFLKDKPLHERRRKNIKFLVSMI